MLFKVKLICHKNTKSYAPNSYKLVVGLNYNEQFNFRFYYDKIGGYFDSAKNQVDIGESMIGITHKTVE